MNVYATITDAIAREIIEPLGEYAGDFDIDAIADEAVSSLGDCRGFVVKQGDEFWAIVERHDISGK